MKIFFTKVRDVKSPERTGKNAGIDFFIPNDYKTSVLHGKSDILIPSGIKLKMPDGFALIAFNKSGITTKHQIISGACVVDENYTGEIHLHLINLKSMYFKLKPGMKILQFIPIKMDYMDLEMTSNENLLTMQDWSERGDKGFGSTGV